MVDNRLTVRKVYSNQVPGEYQVRDKTYIRERLALALFKAMYDGGLNKHYVIKLKEHSGEIDFYTSEYIITADISVAEQYPVRIAMPEYHEMPLRALTFSAIEEMKYRAKYWMRNTWSRCKAAVTRKGNEE
jgi:hypothetical protein